MTDFPTKKELEEVYQRIRPFIHRTPVLTSRMLDEKAQAQVFLKCENLQKMGAFKMRGAIAAITDLNEEELDKGVVTHSSGNFAQALALSSKLSEVNATVVMPENAPKIKKTAVAGYGADIVISGSHPSQREQKLHEVVEETGLTFIHPSNDIKVILGNSTSAIELLEEQPDLDCVVAPVGGGGLLAGVALATKYFGKNAKVYGIEPAQADDARRSFYSGEIQPSVSPDTIADGLRTNLGDVNFPIIRALVEDILLVEEDEIIEAMRFVWERMKIVIEPSSAVAVAGIIKYPEIFATKKVGVIISGGNVDLKNLPF